MRGNAFLVRADSVAFSEPRDRGYGMLGGGLLQQPQGFQGNGQRSRQATGSRPSPGWRFERRHPLKRRPGQCRDPASLDFCCLKNCQRVLPKEDPGRSNRLQPVIPVQAESLPGHLQAGYERAEAHSSSASAGQSRIYAFSILFSKVCASSTALAMS